MFTSLMVWVGPPAHPALWRPLHHLFGHFEVVMQLPVHLGRQSHVWDAEVTNASSGRRMALFRCTQMVLLSR